MNNLNDSLEELLLLERSMSRVKAMIGSVWVNIVGKINKIPAKKKIHENFSRGPQLYFGVYMTERDCVVGVN